MRALILLALIVPGVALAASDGAALYKRCAACHLPTGAGVPGAFPPLTADFAVLANKPDGRRYLALAVLRGVSGLITVGGKTYRGVMPAQAGMTDADIAAVLNHVAVKLAKAGSGFKPFNEAEIKATRAVGVTMTSAQVGLLHAKAGGK